MPAWEAFEARLANFLESQRESLLFHESGNKVCLRLSSSSTTRLELSAAMDLTSSFTIRLSSPARSPPRETFAVLCCRLRPALVRASAWTQTAAPPKPRSTPEPTGKHAAAKARPRHHHRRCSWRGQKTITFSDAVCLDLDSTPLSETPLSATVVTRDLISDQVARLLSDVVKNDASIGEDYAPVGYYGDYEIRGFPIDLATGLADQRHDHRRRAGCSARKQAARRILKGIAGVESGVTSAGGLINYVTKDRPGERPSLDLATDHRGTTTAQSTWARSSAAASNSGLRMNVAGEDIHTYVEGRQRLARRWVLPTADWKLGAATRLMTDFEYQHKVERSEAGYQLLGGTTVPDSTVYPSVMLGYQPWSKPNTFDTFNAGARLDTISLRTGTPPLRWLATAIRSSTTTSSGPTAGTRRERQLPLPRLALLLLLPRRQLRNLRLPQPRRTAHRCPRRGARPGPLHHRQDQPRRRRRRLTLSPLRRSLVPPSSTRRIGVENVYQPNIPYRAGKPIPAGRPLRAGRLQPPGFRHRAGARSSPRHVVTAGRRPIRSGQRLQLHRAPNPVAAAVREHLLARHDLTLYGNYGVLLSLGPAGSVVGR